MLIIPFVEIHFFFCFLAFFFFFFFFLPKDRARYFVRSFTRDEVMAICENNAAM